MFPPFERAGKGLASAGFVCSSSRMIDAPWAEVLNMIDALIAVFAARWGLALPARGSRLSPTEEAACDEWCRQIAAAPHAELNPPEDLRPWILMRLHCAREIARIAAGPNAAPPGEVGERLRWLLLDKWHSHGVRMWPLIASRRS